MSRPVIVALPAPAGDGGWCDLAMAGVVGARQRGVAVEVIVVDPHAEVLPLPDGPVLAHGIQLLGWVTALRARGDRRAVALTDRPAPEQRPEGTTTVDWAWAEGTAVAGAGAAALAGGRPIGLLAGPPVPTQQRVVAAFCGGAQGERAGTPVLAVHLPSFEAADEAAAAARHLVVDQGCAVVAHTCDAAGEAACGVARDLGAATIGFLHPGEGHVAAVVSDVAGVVEELLVDLAGGLALPAEVRCGLASGRLRVDVAEGAPPPLRDAVERALAEALGDRAAAGS
jgi:basic membrane lipoprotein Med (substrate-binding protein (PBP1-ABC) superfamily)